MNNKDTEMTADIREAIQVPLTFKRQPQKMVKHTQTIRRLYS